MDYVAGRDLGALVKDGPLAPQRAARYVKIIAEAIHFAHQRGTLHRDLKPQNVLIDAADQPRITDFGLAKIMKDDSRLTQSGMVMGSPSYMPPEQAAGRHGEVGPASDVYALGAMLYELLTGRPPFRGATALATLREVMEAEPAAPRRLKADIPPDLETVCLKCLEKTPSARYPTARALGEELDRFLKGEPIQARPASAVRKTVSWARRHPGILVAVAALAMVALAFGVIYLFEENAFLRAQQADPTLARVPGPLQESLEMWREICALALFASLYLMAVIEARSRGMSLNEFGDRAKPSRPRQPLDERTRTFAIGAGLALIGCGVMGLVTAIQAHVWEGEPTTSMQAIFEIGVIYGSIYSGLVTLRLVIRDYRLVHYGTGNTSGRRLNAAQIEPIRRALEHHDWPAAIKRYREAVPDAGLAEANEYVTRFPFVPPPLSLATLDWKAVRNIAIFEAVVLGWSWLQNPPSYPVSAVSQFAYSFLVGMGVIAAGRVKSLWKRLLLLVPGLTAMFFSGAFVAFLVEGESYSMASYLGGFFCGIILMAAGISPRRGPMFSKP
jgi:hypothetical protein